MIDDKAVSKLAHLARLAISAEETARLSADLDQIVRFVDQHAELDLDDIEPLAHPLDLTQRTRADAAQAVENRDVIQETAPQVEDGYYIVPKVID